MDFYDGIKYETCDFSENFLKQTGFVWHLFENSVKWIIISLKENIYGKTENIFWTSYGLVHPLLYRDVGTLFLLWDASYPTLLYVL